MDLTGGEFVDLITTILATISPVVNAGSHLLLGKKASNFIQTCGGRISDFSRKMQSAAYLFDFSHAFPLSFFQQKFIRNARKIDDKQS